MAVKLEGTIKRYIGLSTDTKPRPGVQLDGSTFLAADLPPGSSFLESNTGVIYRWSGEDWLKPPIADQLGPLLDALTALTVELAALRLGMMDAGTCNDINPNDAQPIAS